MSISASEPDPAEPDPTEPDPTDPDPTEPDAAEPGAAEPGAAPTEADPAGDPAEREQSSRNVARASRSLVRGLISLGILVAMVVGLLLAIPGLHGVADRVSDMAAQWVVLAVVLEILSCASYVIAFLQVFDRAPVRLGARVALSELAFGAAVSLGGAGSVAVGTWLLVERGAPTARVVERSAVLFLLTSAINVFTLVLAALGLWIGILPGPANPLLAIIPAALGIGVTLAVLLLPAVMDRAVAAREPGKVRVLLQQTARTVRDTERILLRWDWRIIGAIGYLWFDIAVLYACFAASGHTPNLAAIVLAYQLGYLVNIIPIPGSIGILDGSLVGMFVLYGVSATAATAAVVVYHAISLWIPAMWGTAAFLLLRRSRGEPLRLRPPREERQRLRQSETAARRARREARVRRRSARREPRRETTRS